MIRYTTSVAGNLRTVNFFVPMMVHEDGLCERGEGKIDTHFELVAHTYSYGPRSLRYHDPDQDQWEYRLPDGTKYTHPTKEGCLLMILKDFFEEVLNASKD